MVADVTVVGGGLIGLTVAVELADRGMKVRLVGTTHRGEASPAAAGMLAPSVEAEVRDHGAGGLAHAFAVAARDIYPAYLTALEERTAIPVPLNRLGVLELAETDEALERLGRVAPAGSERLDAAGVAELEPALAPVAGGVLYPHDGCVDNLLFIDALRLLVARHPRIAVDMENVCAVHATDDGVTVVTDRTNRRRSELVVLAAGAWVTRIDGLPRPLPIEPVRGQMVAFGTEVTRHVVFGGRGYVVPKADGNTLAGSTMERVGFDANTTDEGIEAVRRIGGALVPVLAETSVSAYWCGLRPVTPDMLPILGPDPKQPNVVYACGHSRNGILLAPLTAHVLADLLTGATPRYDLTPFKPERFSAMPRDDARVDLTGYGRDAVSDPGAPPR